ncbi:hypothetical protein CAPTEDRAFT_145235 [Capitella teleta]|uniref:Charged multivesicular body protein 6 n=1 Tax=Capitella teleta TaxID=283909 RepID=R7T4N0_CAPTE|nr:hypothetical protein CAPTEDRAFT_145235 [Capitella teleta]|eukprot:ELT87903.1 hypothetical protein CAPTEDRAFT_145235 [Capitella teleta]
MGNLFGKKNNKTRVTEQDKAVLQLKSQRDKLKQYQKKIISQLERDRQVAKDLLKIGKKDKAKLLLRKKKFQESMLEKTDGQLENIERMVHDIEFATIESQVVAGLKAGNEALNKLHRLMSIEDVERIMDETQESVQYQHEIDELLAGGLTDEDESDVLDELNQMMMEQTPAVPDTEPEQMELELPDIPAEKTRNKGEIEVMNLRKIRNGYFYCYCDI